jgi:hypothetical protein
MLSKGFCLDPGDKFLNVWMIFQLFDGVVFSFELLFREQGVKLIVTRATDWHLGVALGGGSLTFNFFVVPHSRDQMVAGGLHILSFAQFTGSSHRLVLVFIFGFGLAKYVSCIEGG